MLHKLPISPAPQSETSLSPTENLDHQNRSFIANLTGGLSPISINLVLLNWLMNLSISPGKQLELSNLNQKNIQDLISTAIAGNLSEASPPTIEPSPGDHRFKDESWNKSPFNFYKQLFLSSEQWWESATKGIHGISPVDEKAMIFMVRQMMDIWSPSNFLPTNPEVISKTVEERGVNLLKGFQNLVEDVTAKYDNGDHQQQGKYKVGEDLATTPGKVVYRNHLMELIQYEPTTKNTYPEPLLIVPAWIMKYYILDLSESNSLVKYLVSKGFTVFMISWLNPDSEDANFGLDDYRLQGPMAALNEIERITGAKKIHTAGYCLGGTLLSITAAAMARDGDHRLKSMTLLAAQTDFTEAGELMLFVNESQLSFLEDMMKEQGYLEGNQMSGAFKLLRSNDLFWLRLQQDYLMGKRVLGNDMMSWNKDTTRMPYKMHSEYLRKLFLNNELATEKYEVNDHPISLRDIHLPLFAVGTQTDHVSPWQSVFKIHSLTHSDVTFILTKGGHNAGIISEPGHPRRDFQVQTTQDKDCYISPEDWRDIAPQKEGSWWPEWAKWLGNKSGKKKAPVKIGKSIVDAPGEYVLKQ